MTDNRETLDELAGREFPILLHWRIRAKAGKRSIPWAVIERHKRQAQRNHYQSLERLAERGGLSWCEAAAVLEDREWHSMPDEEAEATVLAIVAATRPRPIQPRQRGK